MDTSTTPARTADSTPRQIGPYTLLERLGAGGMGDVYLAEQKTPVRRRVALKLVKSGLDTREFVARFEAERQALALMNHPNVAAVYDGGATPDGRPYFVMEYVPGEPITDYCDKHKLSIRERLELFIQVCNAVQHAHQKAIIHRDLKPSNILVMIQDSAGAVGPVSSRSFGVGPVSNRSTSGPVPKVIDFGVAKATNQRLTDKTLFTQHGVLVGTPEYMSPEQAESTTLDIDTRTDIYALGVVLYELLTGTLPFERASLRRAPLHEIVRIIREVEPPKPSTRLSSLRDESRISRRGAENAEKIRHVIAEAGRDACSTGSSAGEDAYSDGSGAPDIRPSARARIEAALADAPGADPSSLVERTERAESAGDPLAVPGASLDRIATQRRADARSLLRTVRGDLDWIAMRCLEKDRTRRYDTANALAMEIRRYLSSEPVLAGPPSVRYRLGKFVRRNRGAVTAVTLLTLAILAGMVGTGTFALRERAARKDEQQRRTEIQQVADFQAQMLAQVDPTVAGRLLEEDVNARFEAALVKAGVPEPERAGQVELFKGQWKRVNHTDAARELIDRTILKPAVEAIEKQFKDQPTVDAALRQVLADRYRDLGLYDAAVPLQERALATRCRVLGEDHPDTLASINNMGLLLQSQGKLAEAEPYYREALENLRRVLGEQHPDTLTSINNIGMLLQAQGKLGEAEPYLHEALKKSRRVLGDEHPRTLTSINNMGFLLKAQGKLAEAEPYYREALEKLHRVLGDDHATTLTSISNMGALLRDQGKLAEAEPYLREALKTFRRVLGDEHPNTLKSMSNMGWLLLEQGKLAESESYLRPALEKQRRVLGDKHADTRGSIGNMADLLQAQGKLAEAEPLFLELWKALTTSKYAPAQLKSRCLKRLVDLYEMWHAAEPDKGYDAKAAEWRAKLEEWQASTQPAANTE